MSDRDKLAEVRARAQKSRTVKPYKAGDKVVRHCGKAGQQVVATVDPLNWNNPDRLAVYCPTRGCTRCSMDVERLPVRYEYPWPPTWDDVRLLLDAPTAGPGEGT